MMLEAGVLMSLHHCMGDGEGSDIEEESPEEPMPPESPSESDEEEHKEQAHDRWSTYTTGTNVPVFTGATGKQHAARQAQSALDFLQLYLPPPLIQSWVEYTQAYAQQHGADRDWRTSVSELYAFIGVHIFMGICRLPNYHMYWSKEYQQPFVASTFTRTRYEQLVRYFHVAPTPDPHAPHDPLSRVRPFITSLLCAFPRYYSPSQHLTIDEAMMAYKGRSPIKQYIPMKPHRWGYKIYCLAGDEYLLHFEVYEGRAKEKSPHGATYDTVMRMTAQYQYQHYTLYLDNWFTSPTLAVALKQKGIRVCGSVNQNRKEMPVIAKKDIIGLERGKRIHRQQEDMSIDVWKDKKALWLLYNHCSPSETASLDRWDDDGERKSIECPRAVKDYFYGARSVDIINQLHYAYRIGRKSRKAWWRLAWWLIDMCIVNAYKLWSIEKEGPKHLHFREELMHQLVKLFSHDKNAIQVSRGINVSVALVKDHFLEHTEQRGYCVACSHDPIHRTQTRTICAKCGVHLCIGNCFKLYHS